MSAPPDLVDALRMFTDAILGLKASIDRLTTPPVVYPEKPRPMAMPPRDIAMTPERFALLARLYPTFTTADDILDALDALDGPPVNRAPGMVAAYANKRGLSRPPGYMAWLYKQQHPAPEPVSEPPAAEPAPVEPPAPQPVPAPPPAVAMRPIRPVPAPIEAPKPRPATNYASAPNPWSTNRIDMLRDLFPKGHEILDLVAQLNRMPGSALTRRDVLNRAAALNLNRPAPAAAPGGPIIATLGEIKAWAAQRGIAVYSRDDIPAVNRKCRELGLRHFELESNRF